MEIPPSTSKPFTHLTDESAFTRRYRTHYTQVHVFHPPQFLSSSHPPWITARETTANNTFIFRHPLTSKPYSFTFPKKFDPSIIAAISYHLDESYPVDYLLVFPTPVDISTWYIQKYCSLLALYGGGHLQGCPLFENHELVSTSSPWVKLSSHLDFDDVTVFRDKVYAVGREGCVVLIYYYKTSRKFRVGSYIMSRSRTPGFDRFGWRKRFVVHGENLYLVIRTAEKSFRVYMLKKQGMRSGSGFYWDRVDEFKGNKVLFMARDYYFFRKASRKFPGKEYKNCIVFSEAAFPQYGNGCWEFTKSGDRQFSEDDIAVFRLDDQTFAREGENSVFPKIDWSPPDWILNVSSFPADEFQKHSDREADEDGGLDSDTGDKNDGEVQSDIKDTKSEDEEEQEEMETDFGCLDQDQDGMVSNTDNQDKEDGKLQCDSNSQDKEDEEMHSEEANIEDDRSLEEAHVTPSLSAVEQEVTKTLLRMNGTNDAIEEETSGKNITHAIPKASTSSTTESMGTTKFEGLEIRSDLIPTLQKIWQKHGNIIKDSIVRSGDIVARALESLATMVQILENNPVESLSDSQADYLSSTLSDLRSIRFTVYWLVSFVEKALKVHKSKSLVESFNNLSQLSSQVKERRAILLDEVAKLNEEENKLKEEMGKVSKMIPFSGQVKFDEPIGAGFT